MKPLLARSVAFASAFAAFIIVGCGGATDTSGSTRSKVIPVGA